MKVKMTNKFLSSIKSYYNTVKYNQRMWNYPYYDLKNGISNLIAYFGLIWNDRDWDYNNWLEMNRMKLSRMESFIRNKGNHLYNERDADNIHKAVMAIDRLLADDYHENATKNHYKKWGKPDFSFIDCDDEIGYSELIINHENVKNEKDKELERKEFRRCMKHSDYMKKQDLEYMTEIINKYLFHWWD